MLRLQVKTESFASTRRPLHVDNQTRKTRLIGRCSTTLGASNLLSAASVGPSGSTRPSGNLRLTWTFWNCLIAAMVFCQGRPSTASSGSGPPSSIGTWLSRSWTVMESSFRFLPLAPTDAEMLRAMKPSSSEYAPDGGRDGRRRRVWHSTQPQSGGFKRGEEIFSRPRFTPLPRRAGGPVGQSRGQGADSDARTQAICRLHSITSPGGLSDAQI